MFHSFYTPVWFIKWITAIAGAVYLGVNGRMIAAFVFPIVAIVVLTLAAQAAYRVIASVAPEVTGRWDREHSIRILFSHETESVADELEEIDLDAIAESTNRETSDGAT